MPHTGGDTLRAVWARTCESRETALTAALDGIAPADIRRRGNPCGYRFLKLMGKLL